MATRTLYPTIAPSLDLNFAGSKTLDPRITFNRASAATHYDGKTVAKAEENLLLRSQEFDQAPWEKLLTGAALAPVVTANAGTAPDGTVTADRVVFSLNGGVSSGDISQLVQTVTLSGQYVFSVWLRSADGSSTYNMQLAGAGAVADVAVNGSWQRFTVTGTYAGAYSNQLRLRGAQGIVNSNTADVLVWGAQLEQRSQVTAYTPTTTQPITNYIPVLQTAPAGVPRFDHNPVTGESLGLLMEEQRTNLLLRSQDFSYAVWQGTGSALALAGIAPDGTLSSYKLSEDTSSAVHYKYQGVASTLGTNVYTLSAYVKAAGRSRVQLWSASGSPRFSARFDLAAKTAVNLANVGTASVISSSITEVGNDWYRISVTGTTGTDNVLGINIFLDNGSNHLYQGDGYSGVYIWGVQVEAGSFPTSYIKTEASQVTRVADNAAMSGTNFSSWYRQDEGSMFVEFDYLGMDISGQVARPVSITDGLLNGANSIYIAAQSTNFSAGAHVQAVQEFNFGITESAVANKFYKAGLAFKANYANFSSSGKLSAEDTLGRIPSVSTLLVGQSRFGPSSTHSGHIKRLTYYPKRLTDTQLQALTA